MLCCPASHITRGGAENAKSAQSGGTGPIDNKRPLRILHVSTPSTWRGGEQQLAYLCRELDEAGHQQVIACSRGSEMEAWCREHGVDHVAGRRGSTIDPRFAATIQRVCKSKKIDLVHTHDSHGHTFAILAAALFRNRTPIVVSRRVDFPVTSWSSRYKYNHPCVGRILCVSDAIREIMSAAVRDPGVLATVHSGIDLDRFKERPAAAVLRQELRLEEDVRLIGCVAALAPHKDFFTFIAAADDALRAGLKARFVVLGEGDLRRPLQAEIDKRGIGEHVQLAGFRRDITSVLPGFDVFLLTSQTEGLCTSILDAFAAGVPVVATRAGGIPELVMHEKTGLLNDVKDHEGLARSLQRVLADSELAQSLTRGARHHLQRFTKEATAAATLQHYRQLARR